MTLGLVGRKVGMTRLFTDDGDTVPNESLEDELEDGGVMRWAR